MLLYQDIDYSLSLLNLIYKVMMS